MRILIIGGTGFIGRHVIRKLLNEGHEVVVFHRGKTQPAPANLECWSKGGGFCQRLVCFKGGVQYVRHQLQFIR